MRPRRRKIYVESFSSYGERGSNKEQTSENVRNKQVFIG
jgi:hypothetical protein